MILLINRTACFPPRTALLRVRDQGIIGMNVKAELKVKELQNFY